MSPGERWDRRAPARPKDSPTRAGARGPQGSQSSQGSQDSQSSQDSQGSQGNAKDRRPVEYGWRSGGYLPHFDAPRAIQHITYRLADSLPKEALERLEFELKALPAEKQTIERRRRLERRLERLLDAGFGSRVLLRPEAARIIIETWLRFDQERYRLLAFVVMPNHCHVLIECLDSCPLWKIVNSWKSYTARWINANVLGQKEDKKTTEDSRPGGRRSQGGSQAFWQRDIVHRHWSCNSLNYRVEELWYVIHKSLMINLDVSPEMLDSLFHERYGSGFLSLSFKANLR